VPALTLKEQLTRAIETPARDDAFDLHTTLDELLASVGLSSADSGGTITFRGADPVVPSTLRLAGAASLAIVAKSVAAAKLWQLRGGDGQDITMDLRAAPHRLCPMYDRKWELINGYPPAAPAAVGDGFRMTFHRTADERWMMAASTYPKLSAAAERLLQVPDEKAAVTRAIARWKSFDLEQAAEEAGVVLATVLSTAEILREPQFTQVLAELPLIEISRIGDSAPEAFTPGPEAPLSGVRALGMGHVIAGAGAGRALALHGADVLNLWRPTEFEHDSIYYSANVGMRSATIDPFTDAGRRLISRLLADADVFFANRRPGYLDRIGLSAEAAAELRPGIVHATVSLHGERGPWAKRMGFDQIAGAVTGMMLLEGDGEQPALSPIYVVNDYIVAWLLATGIMEALMRRADNGGSYRVHVSLTRVALWVLSLGVFDRRYAHAISGSPGEHAYLDPETFVAQTPLGDYRGVTDQVHMSVTPGRYNTVLVPRGSGRPQWLGR